jgi:hypothetical protein
MSIHYVHNLFQLNHVQHIHTSIYLYILPIHRYVCLACEFQLLYYFLTAIAMSGVDDVRPVVEFYQAQEDPILVFKENQARLIQQQQAEEQQQQMSEGKASPAGGSNWSASGLFGRFFGRGSSQSQVVCN